MNMNWTRRKLLGAAAALPALWSLKPLQALAEAAKITWRNWGGNLEAEPARVLAPANEQELIDILAASEGPVRPIGSGHSWSGLVPTEGTMITLDGLMGVIEHDPETLQAEVWAGTKLFLLGPMLEQVGQSLPNMSDINYQSLAGAVATSTHGTGVNYGSMSAYVTGARLITAAGEVTDCDAQRRPDLLRAIKNSLGCLGVVSRLRLQNVAAHRLHQQEWLTETDAVMGQIQTLARDNQQFELFPLPNSNRTIVVVTNPAAADAQELIEDEPYAILELKQAFELTQKVPGIGEFLYNQALDFAYGGAKHRIGASHQVLAHPRNVAFIEMEYTVPAELGEACLVEVLDTISKHAPQICFPLEYRYVKADDSLIGMCSERAGCSISVHQFADQADWQDYLAVVEKVFHKYQGRPHWGKWHSLEAAQLEPLYPHWQQFLEIRRELDPTGRMLNPYLRRLLGVTS
jgi:FAD-linked oxidoreductase